MRPDSRVETHAFEALGTNCSLLAVGRTTGELIEGEFWIRRLGARLSRFKPDSEVSQLNNRAGEWWPVSAELEALLRCALDAYAMSAALVNAAVLPSVLMAGYTRPLAEGAGVVTLEGARPAPPLPDVLEVRDGEARVRRGAGIDLGGIAKGWLADRLSDLLGPNCVVNLGGDLRAAGEGPRGAGWPVGMGGATLMLGGQGAATSSVLKRRWAGAHHLIDPRTGLPACTGLEEVSVVTPTAFEAEVVAKSALLLGPDIAPAYCAAHAMAWWLGRGRDD